MKYLDENEKEINANDVWKYEYIDTNNENTIVYMKSPDDAYLRHLRNIECFSELDKSLLWYDTLTDSQKEELKVWYRAWLDVTDTKIIPEKPDFIK